MTKKLEATVLECDVPNQNGRIYPKEVIQKALEKYNEQIAKGLAFGPIGDGELKFREVSFKVTSAVLEEDKVIVQIETLNTPAGKLLEMVQDFGEVALVPSGTGSVTEDELGYDRVNNDYVLTGFSVAHNNPAKRST